MLQEGSGISIGRSTGRIISCGHLSSLKLSDWHTLSLAISSDGAATTMTASIDGAVVDRRSEPEPAKWKQGMVSLRSGFHYALFDDLSIV